MKILYYCRFTIYLIILLHQSLFHIAMNLSAYQYYLYSYEKMIRMRENKLYLNFQEIGNKKYQKAEYHL